MQNNEMTFSAAPSSDSTAVRNLYVSAAETQALYAASFFDSPEITDLSRAGKEPSGARKEIGSGAAKEIGSRAGKDQQALEFTDIFEAQERKVCLKGHISNDVEISRPLSSFEDAKVFFLGAVAPHLHNMSRFDAVNESLLAVGPALDQAVDYYSDKASRLAFDEFLNDGREFCEANAALAARFIDMLSQPMPVEQRGDVAAQAAMVMMPANYGLRCLTKEELGLANVEVLVGTKKMRDGVMTVNIEYMSQPKYSPRVGLGEFFQSIKKMAVSEGASAVKVVCGDQKPKLFTTPTCTQKD